jgi:Uma2 family endonuclease
MEADVLVKKSKAANGKITWADFRDMDIPEGDTSIYELINGQIVKRSSPNSPHQRVSFKLSVEFGIYNKKKKVGEFFAAPFDVYLDEENAGIQPDLLFVSKERSFIVHDNNGIVGAPDLVIEIISKGSGDKDRAIKRDVYERFAVKEYWIVDPLYKSIEVYCMENNRYTLFSYAEDKGIITSSVLPDFKLNLKKIFE